MRYTQPRITRTFAAVTTIKSDKGEGVDEGGSIFLTNCAAYHSQE